jgi:hypothetical protein
LALRLDYRSVCLFDALQMVSAGNACKMTKDEGTPNDEPKRKL